MPWEVIEQALKNPPRLREPDWPSPHPYERPVAGEVLAQEIWDGTDGLGILQSLITGDLPAPPLARFCGIAPVEAKAGTTTWKMPASEWLCAPIQGRLYGGAIAMLAGTAIDGTVQTTLPAGTAFGPVDLKVYFLRPVSPDGRDLVARGTVIHRGPQHGDRHLGRVRRWRQEGCRRDRLGRDPAGPASHRDNRADASGSCRKRG